MEHYEDPAVEQAFEDADQEHPWSVTGIGGDQVVSDRIPRQEAAEGLALGADD